MATRRKYPASKPLKFRDGGAVPLAAEPQPAEAEQQPVERADVPPPPAAAPATAVPSDDGNALRRALEGTLRAQELARQPVTLDEAIDRIPGLSDSKRALLKAHPELLNPTHGPAIGRVYADALAAGIPDDTPEMNERLIAGVRQAMEEQYQRGIEAANAAAAMEPPRIPPVTDVGQAAAQLGREAAAIGLMRSAADATPMALALQSAPEPAPRRPSMPMTAPVSRDTPMLSGHRSPGPGQITLTAEERMIARHSFSDPYMSDAEKEMSYAKNKARLAQLRRDGLYPERERG